MQLFHAILLTNMSLALLGLNRYYAYIIKHPDKFKENVSRCIEKVLIGVTIGVVPLMVLVIVDVLKILM